MSVPFPAETLMALASSLDDAPDVEAIGRVITSGLAPYGFKGFTFAVVRRVKDVWLHARVFSTWPQVIQSAFEQQRLLQADPVIVASRTATRAFAWDLSLYDSDNPNHAELLKIRVDCDVTGGICIPVHEAWDGRSVLYLSGSDFPADPASILKLKLLSEHLCSRVNAVTGHANSGIAPRHVFMSVGELSPRERQVFGWIAFGKSSKDVATIMSISEHTVNDYIGSGIAKLNASNRTEAVLRALLTNQIDLT